MFGTKQVHDRIDDCLSQISCIKNAIDYKEEVIGYGFLGPFQKQSSKKIEEINNKINLLMDYLGVEYLPSYKLEFPTKIVKKQEQKGKK